MNPSFSIITINFNNCSGLRKTIQSVIGQNYSYFEYIIIDGGSTDGSVAMIKEYSDKISFWISEPDRGIYDAMNKGINKASGDFVCFLNSGDEYLSKYSIKIMCSIISSSKSELFFSDYLFVDDKNDVYKVVKSSSIKNKADFLKYNFGHPSTFYKRSLFQKYGCFNTNNNIVSDVEWYLDAILVNKLSFKLVNFVTSIFFDGGISSQSFNKHKLEREIMLSKYFSKFEIKFFSGRTFNALIYIFPFNILIKYFFDLKFNREI